MNRLIRLDRFLTLLGFCLLMLYLLCGCYVEPQPQAWTGDRTTSTACELTEGGATVSVTSDFPLWCAAVAANLHAAVGAIGLEPGALEGLTVHYQGVRCLQADGDGNACTYAATTPDGDASDWAGAHIEFNQVGTQWAHELHHVQAAWRNQGGNSQHQSPAWSDADFERVDAAARAAWAVH